MDKVERKIGTSFEDENYLVHFGTSALSLENIASQFSYNFKFINQVHGDVCIDTENKEREADAHYTKVAEEALIIKTADCLPIMVWQKGKVFAIHAGWRGLENKILYKSLKDVSSTAIAFVGPHIREQSFEVGLEFKNYFEDKYFKIRTNQKPSLNLTQIALDQLIDIGFSKDKIHFCKEDTFISGNMNSYRRDKTKNRNLSFILLK